MASSCRHSVDRASSNVGQVRARHGQRRRRHEAQNRQEPCDLVAERRPQPQVAPGQDARAPGRRQLPVVDPDTVSGEDLVDGVDPRLHPRQGGPLGEPAHGLERRQTAVHDVASPEVLVGHHRRNPERALERRPDRAPEARGRHTDDVVHRLVQPHRPADDRRVGRELAAPQEVREHHDAMPAGDDVVGRADEPPEGGPHAEHGEERARHHLALVTLRKRSAGHRHEYPAERREVDAAVERGPELAVVGVRHRRVLGAARHVQRHQLVAGREAQRPHERLVEQARDEGRAGHPDGEREHAGRRPAGLAGEGAAGEAQVLPHVAEPVMPRLAGFPVSHGRIVSAVGAARPG